MEQSSVTTKWNEDLEKCNDLCNERLKSNHIYLFQDLQFLQSKTTTKIPRADD